MHSLLVLVIALGVAAADVGLGYNYKPPTFATYGVPSYQASSSSSQYNVGYNNGNGLNYKVTGHNQGSGYQGSGYQGSGHQGSGYQGSGYQGSGYQGSGYQGSGYQGSSGFQNAANNVYQGNGGYQAQTIKPVSGFQNNYQGIYNGANIHKETVQYQGGQFGSYAHQSEVNKVNSYQNSYELSSQPAQIFKHFYVHAAPEDEEPPKPRTPVVLPPPQKHYKIIFIKAPTQAASAPQVIPVPQQTEEKTIVYVLVNKPEDAKNIVVPKVEQKPPAKPEVFFIKYNNKDGSQAVIDNIVKDYNNGQSVSFTNVGSAGTQPAPSLLFGTYGLPNEQGGNIVSSGSSGSHIVSNSGFGASNTESSFGSQPLALGVSGVSDGTLGSSFVGTGTTASNVDSGYSSSSSGTGINGVSSTAGYNDASSGSGYNTATSSTGYNSASSSIGHPGASSIVFNGVTGGNGFHSSSSSNEYSNFISSTALPDSEYNGSTISTSQGIPHETYGVPKFRV